MRKTFQSFIRNTGLVLLCFATIVTLFTRCKKEDLLPKAPSTPSNGQGMFWTASDLGCGTITVNVGGYTGYITSYYSTGIPGCNAAGSATFSLAPGSYTYTASCTGGNTWSGVISITENGCSRIQLTGAGGGGGGGGSTTGQGMFWIASDLGCGNITVVCNGITRTINSFYGSAPACGSSGCATFDLSPGTYSYSASCTGKTWSGSITITAGGCNRIQLTSSGPSSGELTFFTTSDLGCGTINVTCNGVTKTITQYYPSGNPNCGATGCANFTLAPGTYSFTASCSGRTWSGSNTVTAGGCMLARLY